MPTIVEGGEELITKWTDAHPAGSVVTAPPASEWPFRFPLCPELPAGPVLLRATNTDTAFVNAQSGGIHLVTSQRGYLEAEWRRALEAHGNATLLMTPGSEEAISHPLALAFRLADPAARLARCVEFLKPGRTPAALVATASVCIEVNDLEAAARDLDEAIGQAPEWAAAHYERGKLWLRADDMIKASESFQRAADLLPGFAPAWANLGGTLGELDRPADALAAFERALALDPASPQALNNVGVVRRELGRLAESEAAFRRVVQLTPGMAFGHYNLGHTLFLQGRFQAALAAYAEGQARDPEKNPVQASRLALCKVATGDAPGALRELQRATAGLPREYRQQLLGDTSAIMWALVTQHPELQQWQPVQEWLTKELKG
ncbi:MAG: tetratricopeptide repeat protein [Cyanobacteria bacterium]|nr:tetratricopeptide repeat protein [Cyanobacteriota bacterium]